MVQHDPEQRALSPEEKAGIFIVGGATHPELAESIARSMGMELNDADIGWHPSGDPYVRYEDNVRGKHAFLIQSHARSNEGESVSDAFHQHQEMVNAAMLASASHITVVAPILAGARQDRRSRGRESISIMTTLRTLKALGATSVVAVDLHTLQSSVAFDGPFEPLPAKPLLQDALEREIEGDRQDYVLVAPDAGRAKLTEAYGRDMSLEVVDMPKHRDGDEVKYPDRIDGVGGRTCLVIDDMIDTAGTIVGAAKVLRNSGADRIVTAATHGIFSDPAVERLADSPIDQIIITDTVPTASAQEGLGERLKVVSIAGKVADSLVQIATNGSVSGVYNGEQFPT